MQDETPLDFVLSCIREEKVLWLKRLRVGIAQNLETTAPPLHESTGLTLQLPSRPLYNIQD